MHIRSETLEPGTAIPAESEDKYQEQNNRPSKSPWPESSSWDFFMLCDAHSKGRILSDLITTAVDTYLFKVSWRVTFSSFIAVNIVTLGYGEAAKYLQWEVTLALKLGYFHYTSIFLLSCSQKCLRKLTRKLNFWYVACTYSQEKYSFAFYSGIFLLANKLLCIQSKERVPLVLSDGQAQWCHVRAISSHLRLLGNQCM